VIVEILFNPVLPCPLKLAVAANAFVDIADANDFSRYC